MFSFFFFLDKNNIILCKNLSDFLEKSFNFTNTETTDIIACVPDLINLTFEQIKENFDLICNFLNLDKKLVNNLILEYPSILAKSNPNTFKKIELYFNIYLGFEKTDLRLLIQKNPLLFNIDVYKILFNKY